MAELKSLIVHGSTRLNNTAYAKEVHADSYVTNDGTSSQFVKGDGTLDSNTYLTQHQDISGKQDKPTITTVSASTLTQEIADNTIYNAGELSALTITLPSTVTADFISEVDFTSGTTATTSTIPNTVLVSGSDVVSGVFTPLANKRYTLMFYSNGVNMCAVSKGFSVS